MDMQALISLGGTGILAYILWQYANRFLGAMERQIDGRIKELEKRCENCENDRMTLHTKLELILERNARVDVARETHSVARIETHTAAAGSSLPMGK